MARVGLQYLRYCLIDDKDKLIGDGKALAKMIKSDLKVNTEEVDLYADDTLAESAKMFKDGSITFEVDEISQLVASDLLGHKLNADEELVHSGDDLSPFAILGYIVPSIKKNGSYYTVNILCKAQFSEPDQSDETKGDKLAFKSTTIVGKIYRNNSANWKISKRFENLREALCYLDIKLNVDMLQVKSVAGTTTGSTLITITPEKATANRYVYDVGADVKLPATGDTVDLTEWDGTTEISTTAGYNVVVCEVDSDNCVVRRGITQVKVKE